MYAHYAIDSLTCEEAHPSYIIDAVKRLKLKEEIKRAQKFNIGAFSGLPLMNVDENTLRSTMQSWGRLPYNIMWIDFIVNDPDRKRGSFKVGFLSTALYQDVIALYIFTSGEGDNQFKLSPIVFICDVQARPLSDCGLKSNTDVDFLSFVHLDNDAEAEEAEETFNFYLVFAGVFNRIILLLNCKNISTQKKAAPKALNKKRRKRCKTELYSYHTLKVVMPRKSGGHHECLLGDLHNRSHLRMGHFKMFTRERPLFGKHVGVYWWGPHWAGRNRNGVVMKDYEVRGHENRK